MSTAPRCRSAPGSRRRSRGRLQPRKGASGDQISCSPVRGRESAGTVRSNFFPPTPTSENHFSRVRFTRAATVISTFGANPAPSTCHPQTPRVKSAFTHNIKFYFIPSDTSSLRVNNVRYQHDPARSVRSPRDTRGAFPERRGQREIRSDHRSSPSADRTQGVKTERTLCRELVQKLLTSGVLRPSDSFFTSPPPCRRPPQRRRVPAGLSVCCPALSSARSYCVSAPPRRPVGVPAPSASIPPSPPPASPRAFPLCLAECVKATPLPVHPFKTKAFLMKRTDLLRFVNFVVWKWLVQTLSASDRSKEIGALLFFWVVKHGTNVGTLIGLTVVFKISDRFIIFNSWQ